MHESYRKLSLEHTKKVSKDIQETINKDGKNNSKFPEPTECELETLLNIFYMMDENEHFNFPYTLFESLCMNTHAMSQLIAAAITILHLTPMQHALKYALLTAHPIVSQKIITNTHEMLTNYDKIVYPLISLKFLHLFAHLSRAYSFSMNMLRINARGPPSLIPLARPEQSQRSSF